MNIILVFYFLMDNKQSILKTKQGFLFKFHKRTLDLRSSIVLKKRKLGTIKQLGNFSVHSQYIPIKYKTTQKVLMYCSRDH